MTLVAIFYVGARQVISGELSAAKWWTSTLPRHLAILRLAQIWQDLVDRLGDILNTPAEPG